MRKIIAALALAFLLFLSKTEYVSAEVYMAGSSAKLKSNVIDSYEESYRVLVLRQFFGKHNSPLSPYAQSIIKVADDYQLDWRLVPAITGVESTFGKRIPAGSYNAYGWANGAYYFESWEDSIEVVSRTLREKYLDRGATSIDKIARRYAPPSSTWAWKVRFFMRKIDPLPLTFTL